MLFTNSQAYLYVFDKKDYQQLLSWFNTAGIHDPQATDRSNDPQWESVGSEGRLMIFNAATLSTSHSSLLLLLGAVRPLKLVGCFDWFCTEDREGESVDVHYRIEYLENGELYTDHCETRKGAWSFTPKTLTPPQDDNECW